VDIDLDQASKDPESTRKTTTDFTREFTTESLYAATFDGYKDLLSGEQPNAPTTSELDRPRVQHINAEDEELSDLIDDATHSLQSSLFLPRHSVFDKDVEHCPEKTNRMNIGVATQTLVMHQKRKASTKIGETFESVMPTKLRSDKVEDVEKLSYKRRHRRNCAALRINTTDLISPIKTNTEEKEPTEEVSILSPEPVSPGRQLKVKNSIPQLMKALPPLPPESRGSVDQDITLTAGKDTTDMGGGLSVKDRGNGKQGGSSGPIGTITNERVKPNTETPPKFKVRVRTSPSETSCGQFTDGSVLLAHSKSTGSHARKKLKVKVPGHSLQQGQKGKLLHGAVLKQCNSVADLSHSPRNVSLKHRGEFISEPICGEIALGIPNVSLRSVVECGNGSISSQPSDQFDLVHLPSLSNVQAGISAAAFKCKDKRRQELLMDYWPPRNSEPKLRHKFSFLKHHINGGKPSMLGRAREPSLPCQRLEKNENKPNVMQSAELTRLDESVGRVLRWARGAKRIVRSYVRKTLD
jgi:hypothetical protein